MAYEYDEYGMPYWVDDEEERKKKEQAAADEVVQSKTVDIYGDGSQTVTTETEVPAPVKPAPTAFVGTPVEQRVVNAPIRPEDISPELLGYTRQQESGQRPGIGYHYPAQAGGQRPSTAYGAYGITAPHYQEIQKNFPEHRGRSIEEAQKENSEALGRASMATTARQLQALGVEPTEQNIAGAHLIGAGGMRNYLQTGRLNPAQAAQFGGMAGFEKAVQGRMGFKPSPASGAAEPAQPGRPVAPVAPEQPEQPAIPAGQGLKLPGVTPPPAQPVTSIPTTHAMGMYQQAQDNPLVLMKMRGDEKLPEFIRERAGNRAYELMDQEFKKNQAMEQAKTLMTAVAGGDRGASNQLAKELVKDEGSWLKMILLGFVSPELAGQEAIKLGLKSSWTTADVNGTPVMIKTRADGKPMEGYNANTGAKLSEKDLIAATANVGKKIDVVGGTYVNDTTGEVGRVITDPKTGNSYVQTDKGRRPMAGFRPQSSTGTLQNMRDRQLQELNLKLQGKTLEEKMAILRPYNQQLVANGFPAISPEEVGIAAPQIGAAPAAAPAAPAAVQPPAAPVTGPAVPGTAAVGQAPVPAAPVAPMVRPTGPALEAGAAATKGEATEFVKYGAEDIIPKADAGGKVSRIRKEQVKGPDGLLNNPEIAGVLQGGSGSEVANIVRDLVTGNFKDQADLSSRVAGLNLTQRQKEVLYRQINLSLQVAPETLKQNAGAGAISEAEHKANRAANIDVTRQPLYSALTDLGRSQFVNDLAVARSEFKAARPDLNTTAKFNSAWNAEKDKIQKQFDNIFEARAAYIAKYNKDGKNPGAVVDAFKHYPTPEWDSRTKSWELLTDYARKAARPKLSEFIK